MDSFWTLSLQARQGRGSARAGGLDAGCVQQCSLLCLPELACLHTSHNYHLHSQRHLLQMGRFHLLKQFPQRNLHWSLFYAKLLYRSFFPPMVFNRSKYLRGKEGTQKEGGWGLGRVVVRKKMGKSAHPQNATCMPHLELPSSTTVQDLSLGNATSNIYCLPIYLSW